MRFYVPFVAAALATALASPAFAQSSDQGAGRSGNRSSNAPPAATTTGTPTGWVADLKTGCKIWDDAPDPEESMTWSGECADGMAEGKGTLQFFIGDKPAASYEGDMRGGRADGHGINIEPDGARYEGQWRNNAADGFGTYTRDGKRFEGTWSKGCLKQGADEIAVGVTRESCGFK
jgi:hypothetical protein